MNNLIANFDIWLCLCKLLNPTAASVSESLWCRVVSWLLHTFTHSQLERGVCGDLPAISITFSAAKWGERHRQPTGMVLLFWASGSRGPDCFAQGQHDLGIVIYILVDCILFFYTPPRKLEHAIAWPEFDINCTPPRRSSTSQLEFVVVKTKPWHSSSIQNKIMFVLMVAGCRVPCPQSLSWSVLIVNVALVSVYVYVVTNRDWQISVKKYLLIHLLRWSSLTLWSRCCDELQYMS